MSLYEGFSCLNLETNRRTFGLRWLLLVAVQGLWWFRTVVVKKTPP